MMQQNKCVQILGIVQYVYFLLTKLRMKTPWPFLKEETFELHDSYTFFMYIF